MNERDRLLAVLKKKTPDRVPWFADLGHWYRAESGEMWDLFSINNCTDGIVDLHKEVKAGWYIEVGSIYEESYEGNVTREREIIKDTAFEAFRTPLGEITMERQWNSISSSWDIKKLMVETPKDLEVLLYTIERKVLKPKYENWEHMEKTWGDVGLGFPSLGYTGLGSLISYYMGVENTIYAIHDEPELIERYIDTYNRKFLEAVDICCNSPAPHFIFTDNLSSEVQPPSLFMRYSFKHYKEVAEKFHSVNKTVSAHMDGTLKNLIGIVASAGIDVADACTPKPTGDLNAEQIRQEAGNDIVLMGGISPVMWLPEIEDSDFIAHIREWLDLRKINSRMVQSAGDQVPPGTKLSRIKLVHELVEEYGRYDTNQ